MRKGRILLGAALAVVVIATLLPAGATHQAWTWLLQNFNTAGGVSFPAFPYGNFELGDLPVTGNWDGSVDSDDPGVARPLSNGHWAWYLRNQKNQGPPEIPPFEYGNWTLGDFPVVGDWDGGLPGTDTIGVVRPMDNGRWKWFLRNVNSVSMPDLPPFEHGNWTRGDFPVVGDWDGDEDDDVGVVRPNFNNGRLRWLLTQTDDGVVSHDFEYGNLFLGDLPLPGDWDGLNEGGGDTAGVVRALDNGRLRWLLKNALETGDPDPAPGPFEYGNWTLGDFPVKGDWDQSGSTNVNEADTPGVVRPPA